MSELSVFPVSSDFDPIKDRYRAIARIVEIEAVKAHGKFGDQFDYTEDGWLSILVEEVGEVAHELNERALGRPYGDISAEIAQIAAVAIRWLAYRRATALPDPVTEP